LQQNIPERFALLLVNGGHDKDTVFNPISVFFSGGFSSHFVLPSRNKNNALRLPGVQWGNAEKRHRQGAALPPCSTMGQVVSQLVGAVLKVLLGLLQPAKVKNLMEFCHH